MDREPDAAAQALTDRSWRLWSSAAVGGILLAGALLGFIVIPIV